MAKKKNDFNFEDSMNNLEKIVEKMESGDLSLEESLQHFEEGIALTRHCQKALDEAEQKVKILMEKDGKTILENFNNNGKED